MRSTRSPQGSAPSQAKPRLHLARPYRRDLSAPVAAAARQAGIELLPWQVELLRDWTAIGDDGKFVHPRCGASIPRQAGKSVDGIAWSLSLAVFMGYKVLWTDHNYSTTCEMLDRFRAILGRKVADDSAEHPRFNARVTEVNNKTIVERGLVPGEYIVTEGYHKLSHGDRALPLLNTGDDAAPAAAEPVEEGAGSVAAPMGEAAAGEGVEAPAADSATVKAAFEGAPAAEKGDSIKK